MAAARSLSWRSATTETTNRESNMEDFPTQRISRRSRFLESRAGDGQRVGCCMWCDGVMGCCVRYLPCCLLAPSTAKDRLPDGRKAQEKEETPPMSSTVYRKWSRCWNYDANIQHETFASSRLASLVSVRDSSPSPAPCDDILITILHQPAATDILQPTRTRSRQSWFEVGPGGG